MKKPLFSLMLALCLLLSCACYAEEEELQVDVTFDAYGDMGGELPVTDPEGTFVYNTVGIIAVSGQTIGEALAASEMTLGEPTLADDTFEGWMEVTEATIVDEDGFEDTVMALVPDAIYTTEELLQLVVPDHNVMYVAKWASIPVEEYFAPYEEETIYIPSVTLIAGEGTFLMNSEEEQYESTMNVTTIEPGQTFGEVLELDRIVSITAEGKEFIGWTVYEYDVETVEYVEAPVEEEGVFCYELFEGYYFVLREYTVCSVVDAEAEFLTTEQLAALACEAQDHLVIANFK